MVHPRKWKQFSVFAMWILMSSGVIPPAIAQADSMTPVAEKVALDISPQRTLELHVFVPATKPRAVIFVSHGGGSNVDAMSGVIVRLLKENFAVLAPLHTDSVSLPESKRENLQTAFGSRMADMTATAAYARQRFAGLPLGGLGYSYGSLFAMMAGGAVDYVAPVKVPEMKAVLTFSSAGLIPGLIMPDQAFSRLAVPTMMITGTRDVVPGFAPDPAVHLVPFEKAPAGDRYALIVKDATHEFVDADDARFERVWTTAMSFYEAYLLDDKIALRELAQLAPTDEIDFRKR